jgi:hypothetical protein
MAVGVRGSVEVSCGVLASGPLLPLRLTLGFSKTTQSSQAPLRLLARLGGVHTSEVQRPAARPLPAPSWPTVQLPWRTWRSHCEWAGPAWCCGRVPAQRVAAPRRLSHRQATDCGTAAHAMGALAGLAGEAVAAAAAAAAAAAVGTAGWEQVGRKRRVRARTEEPLVHGRPDAHGATSQHAWHLSLRW